MLRVRGQTYRLARVQVRCTCRSDDSSFTHPAFDEDRSRTGMSIRFVMSGEFSSGEYQEVRFKQNFIPLLNFGAQSQINNPVTSRWWAPVSPVQWSLKD